MAIATPKQPVYTTSNGAPVADPEKSLRIGQSGPLLLQDFNLIDLLAHFDRERIPERVVHAKGAGAYGEFEVTKDISDIVSNDLHSRRHWLTGCSAQQTFSAKSARRRPPS